MGLSGVSLPGVPAPQRSLSCLLLSHADSSSFLERLVERFIVGPSSPDCDFYVGWGHARVTSAPRVWPAAE